MVSSGCHLLVHEGQSSTRGPLTLPMALQGLEPLQRGPFGGTGLVH